MSDGMSDSYKKEQHELMLDNTNDLLKNDKSFLKLIKEYKKYSQLMESQNTAIKNKEFLLAQELENSINKFDIKLMTKQILKIRREAYGKDQYYDYIWDRLDASTLFYFPN